MHLKKIVIIGPESTGKSTLCKQLAEHFQTLWVPEFAREYLLKNGMNYSYDDLLFIAKEQIVLEEMYLGKLYNSPLANNASHYPLTTPHSPLLFIDTDMYVMKVWCEFVFQKCHRWILDQIVERKYDLYLLCNIDLPWVVDELREYPDIKPRETLFKMYNDILINQDVPWAQVNGGEEMRLLEAIKIIKEFLGWLDG